MIFFTNPVHKYHANQKLRLTAITTHQHAIKYLGIYSTKHSLVTINVYNFKKLSGANGLLAKIRHYAPGEILSIPKILKNIVF